MIVPITFEEWCALFLLFIVYSVLGWCGEMLYCSIPKGRLCEKRGFLNGLLCPIYGHGALLVLYALRGGFKNPLLTFLAGLILTSALEYFTSYLMEKAFHMRWWDYSHYRFQINGRVCLLNSTCFGLACVLLCHVVHPRLWAAILSLGSAVIVPLASFLLGIYLTDAALSIRSAIQLGSRLKKLQQLESEVKAHLAQHKDELVQKVSAFAEQRREALERRTNEIAADFMRELNWDDPTDDWVAQFDQYLAERRERMRRLRNDPDIFERRLLHSHPSLRDTRCNDALDSLRRHLRERSAKK